MSSEQAPGNGGAPRDNAVGGTLRAGVAKRDLTTSAAGVVIHDPLHAKALVLDDGQTKVAIIAMDVVAIGGISEVADDFLPRLRARIEGELGIAGSHVLVNASHTHPPCVLLCDAAEQVDRTLDAVSQARQNMTAVTVGTGVGHEDRFTINRTLRLKNGKHWTIRHAYPCPPDEEVAGLGPLDPDIGILRLDRLGGQPLAVVFNFACHPLFGFNGGPITSNYPGFAARVIEDNLGDGAMALFLQGAGGDVCDVLYKDVHHPRDVRPFGMMLGLSSLQAWAQIETGDATLKVISETVRLPRRTDIPERIAALRQEQAELLASLRSTSLNFRSFLPLYLKHVLNPDYPADYSYRYLQEEAIGRGDLRAMDTDNRGNIEKYLSNLRAMEQLAKLQDDLATLAHHQALNAASGETTIAAEVQGIRIGDCVLITSPAEVLTEVGLRVKQASPHRYTFMAAFSNGYIHYGAPADYYEKGGYEVTECLLAPEWQQVYEAKAAEVLARL
jgi:hypothetical protein